MKATTGWPIKRDAHSRPHGYEVVRFNATKHGVVSRYSVFRNENHADYQGLVPALMDEHRPVRATEQHLIDELASVIWRKRGVLQEEGATINQRLKVSARSAKTVVPAAAPFQVGMSGESTYIRDLIALTPGNDSQIVARHDLEATHTASSILRTAAVHAYDKAQRALLPDLRQWWQSYLGDDKYTADVNGPRTFIRGHLEPLRCQQERKARHHEGIKNPTLGEGLIGPDCLQVAETLPLRNAPGSGL